MSIRAEDEAKLFYNSIKIQIQNKKGKAEEKQALHQEKELKRKKHQVFTGFEAKKSEISPRKIPLANRFQLKESEKD